MKEEFCTWVFDTFEKEFIPDCLYNKRCISQSDIKLIHDFLYCPFCGRKLDLITIDEYLY